jgi:hypothetical protein
MLSDVLGIAIAFITIILLLSVLVTSLTQLTQAVFRLRARNLMKGISAVIIKAQTKPGKEPTKDNIKEAKNKATQILNAPNIALVNRVANPSSTLGWLLGPKTSWVEAEDLPEAIKWVEKEEKPETNDEDVEDVEQESQQITQDFKRIDRPMRKRFQLIMRWWTLVWAFLVAFLFQVSTPALLGELSQDAARRERIVAGVDHIIAHTEESLTRQNYEDAADEALQVLQMRYPQHQELIERASGVGVTREYIVEELKLVLKDVPERVKMVMQYRDLLDRLAAEQLEEAKTEAEYAIQRLGQYDIRVWSQGLSFYEDDSGVRWNAILGVLITAVLLSFGAPFWYEQLRNVVALRDALKPRSADTEDTTETQTEGVDNTSKQGK